MFNGKYSHIKVKYAKLSCIIINLKKKTVQIYRQLTNIVQTFMYGLQHALQILRACRPYSI